MVPVCKACEMADEVSHVESHSAARYSVSIDLKSVVGVFEHSVNRANVNHWCQNCSAIPTAAAFFSLLPRQDGFKNCYETLTFDYQGISELPHEIREIRLKMVEHEKTDAASETTIKSHKKKRATAANKLVVALEAQLAKLGMRTRDRLIWQRSLRSC